MVDPVIQPRTGKIIRSPKVVSRRSEVCERLLETAARMFVDKGVNNVSVEELLDAVSISRATFYGFFANKTELAANVMLPVFKSGDELLNGRRPAHLAPVQSSWWICTSSFGAGTVTPYC
ncbi:MAG: TetR/AcrR family transcriptional regulator [Gammaproteobacteria bacterium]